MSLSLDASHGGCELRRASRPRPPARSEAASKSILEIGDAVAQGLRALLNHGCGHGCSLVRLGQMHPAPTVLIQETAPESCSQVCSS